MKINDDSKSNVFLLDQVDEHCHCKSIDVCCILDAIVT